MNKQMNFSDIEYSNRKRTTKREEFLNLMDEIIPWESWIKMISKYYPSGKRGRPTRGIETMLRMYLITEFRFFRYTINFQRLTVRLTSRIVLFAF